MKTTRANLAIRALSPNSRTQADAGTPGELRTAAGARGWCGTLGGMKRVQSLRHTTRSVAACALLGIGVALHSQPSLAIDEVVFVNLDLKDRLSGREYKSRDSSYRMRVPDLGPKVFVKDQAITPGITSWTQFLSEELGALYIVSTRIRDGLPKDDSILPRVASRYQRYLDGNPKGYAQQYTDGRYGKVFEFTLINARSGLGTYPLAITLQPETSIQTFASHRFFVAGGYLFEFALLIHTKGVALGLSTEELTKKASAVLDEALNAFTPISPQ